ncbi:MAG TPA: N-6 DNA methylase [Pirellulales bacterium]|nr:N-6 DNA methylase [Pirellulales bacterium]
MAFPELVRGLWAARPPRRKQLGPAVVDEVFDGAVEWLFRLLLLFYADARGKLPAGRAPSDSRPDSLDRLRAELAEIGGDSDALIGERFAAAFRRKTELRDRVERLLAPLNCNAVFERHGRPPRRIPEACLARAIDGLSRRWPGDSRRPEPIDYRRLSVRELGAVYERLLECRLEGGPSSERTSSIQPGADKLRRKARGCFYTPEPIVRHIVQRSAGAALDEKLAALEPAFRLARRPAAAGASSADDELVNRFFDFRVLDPAMGTGYFLVEAADSIARRMATFLDRFKGNPVSAMLRETRPGRRRSAGDGPSASRAADWELLKRLVIERCIYGIDLDPRAAELARASLWLESTLPLDCFSSLGARLRRGDALSGDGLDGFPGPGEFDVVVGNPPYGAKLDRTARKSLSRRLPLMKSNSDTAVGFIERASNWLRPGGRAGLIVPKPLTYSYAWRGVRAFLHRRLEHLIDVGRAWADVRLEQVIVVFGGANLAPAAAYRAAWTRDGRICKGARISWALADRFQTFPCAVTPAELKRAANLRLSDAAIGDVCRTFRGIPAQRWLAGDGPTPVIGGRDLERWRIRGASGRLPADGPFDLAPFAREKLVFQNIIAHVARPRPHILLIGAYDAGRTVTLDTVNNLVATDARVDLQGLCGLLHSRLVNWLVYSLIYNKAIRTMHFDQYFLDKIPLPVDWPRLLARLAPAAKESQATSAALAEIAAGFAGQFAGPAREESLRLAQSRLAESRRQAMQEIDRLADQAFLQSDVFAARA